MLPKAQREAGLFAPLEPNQALFAFSLRDSL